MEKRLVKISILFICLCILFACSEDKPARRAAAAKKPTASKGIAPPLSQSVEEIKEVKYVYNPLGARDPFENPLKVITEVATESGIPLTPLQKFDLGQLRLIGVIIGRGEPRAMVIAPDGKSFILKSGIKIGKNDGTIVDITTDSVLVKEKYYDFTGEVKTSIQEIMLPKQGGVK